MLELHIRIFKVRSVDGNFQYAVQPEFKLEENILYKGRLENSLRDVDNALYRWIDIYEKRNNGVRPVVKIDFSPYFEVIMLPGHKPQRFYALTDEEKDQFYDQQFSGLSKTMYML